MDKTGFEEVLNHIQAAHEALAEEPEVKASFSFGSEKTDLHKVYTDLTLTRTGLIMYLQTKGYTVEIVSGRWRVS